MGKLLPILVVLSAVYVAYYLGSSGYFSKPEEPVEFPADGYFGPGAKPTGKQDESIEKFTIHVPDSDLEDLRRRLESARTYEPLENVAFEYGMSTTLLYDTIRPYWLHKYDWRKHEASLNQFDHFRTSIEGLKVHYIHAKPPSGKYARSAVRPLLLVHGWPGSVLEFYKILPMLTDPAKYLGETYSDVAFEVIVPSLPGYGWSDAPRKPGWPMAFYLSASRVFRKLMVRLGHRRFFAQGGDWGSAVVTGIAALYPDSLIGVHTNMPFVDSQRHPLLQAKQLLAQFAPQLVLPAEDRHKVMDLKHLLRESGYMHIQATKPDTVGFALNDSPLGLAAYILEKFSTWTNPRNVAMADGNLTEKFSLDELLTNVMIYWTTGSIASSQRLYKESFDPAVMKASARTISVPAGFAMFPNELLLTPRAHLDYQYAHIVHYTDMPRGGHFAAFEEPKLLALDIVQFVRATDAWYREKDGQQSD